MSGSQVRRYDLSTVVDGDWFSPDFESQRELRLLADVLGERFLAFSWIAGVRFTGLVIDEAVPHASEVEFLLGEGGEAAKGRMTVAELQRRLVAALLAEEGDVPQSPLPEEPDEAQLRRLVGGSWLLLGPLFGLVPRALLVRDGVPSAMEVERAGDCLELPLDAYRQVVRRCVLEELAQAERGRTLELDVADLEAAEEAAERGHWDEVVRRLADWPRYLLYAVRSGGGDTMKAAVRTQMGRALGLLGLAAARLGDEARREETFRIGLQWAAAVGGEVASDLFLRHGEACVLTGRFGEAIAAFERARRLGADPSRVLPRLAESHLERGRVVAALGVCRMAVAEGIDRDLFASCLERVEERLGEPLRRWREASASEV